MTNVALGAAIDTLILSRPAQLAEGFVVFPLVDGAAGDGIIVYALRDLAPATAYVTENGTRLERVSDDLVKIGGEVDEESGRETSFQFLPVSPDDSALASELSPTRSGDWTSATDDDEDWKLFTPPRAWIHRCRTCQQCTESGEMSDDVSRASDGGPRTLARSLRFDLSSVAVDATAESLLETVTNADLLHGVPLYKDGKGHGRVVFDLEELEMNETYQTEDGMLRVRRTEAGLEFFDENDSLDMTVPTTKAEETTSVASPAADGGPSTAVARLGYELNGSLELGFTLIRLASKRAQLVRKLEDIRIGITYASPCGHVAVERTAEGLVINSVLYPTAAPGTPVVRRAPSTPVHQSPVRFPSVVSPVLFGSPRASPAAVRTPPASASKGAATPLARQAVSSARRRRLFSSAKGGKTASAKTPVATPLDAIDRIRNALRTANEVDGAMLGFDLPSPEDLPKPTERERDAEMSMQKYVDEYRAMVEEAGVLSPDIFPYYQRRSDARKKDDGEDAAAAAAAETVPEPTRVPVPKKSVVVTIEAKTPRVRQVVKSHDESERSGLSDITNGSPAPLSPAPKSPAMARTPKVWHIFDDAVENTPPRNAFEEVTKSAHKSAHKSARKSASKKRDSGGERSGMGRIRQRLFGNKNEPQAQSPRSKVVI